MRNGRLGRLVTVNASSTVLKPDAYYNMAWRREPGGGPVLINLVHDIDALRFLCGEIETVQAITANEVRGSPVEDTAAVLLRFSNGALATIMLSDATPSPWCWDQTAGENPAFPRHDADAYRLSGTERLWKCRRSRYGATGGARLGPEAGAGGHTSERRDPLGEQMQHFLRVVRREEPPLVSGRDGARTVAATLAVGRLRRNRGTRPAGRGAGVGRVNR